MLLNGNKILLLSFTLAFRNEELVDDIFIWESEPAAD